MFYTNRKSHIGTKNMPLVVEGVAVHTAISLENQTKSTLL